MDDSILLTTVHNVFIVNEAGNRSKISYTGSVLIPWQGVSRIEVEGEVPERYRKIFHPPKQNVTIRAEIIHNTDAKDMRYTWLDIYHANHSLEHDIVKKTINEVELIKKESTSKKLTFLYGLQSPLLFLLA